MFALLETDKFSNVFPAQHPSVGRATAMLKNLLEDAT